MADDNYYQKCKKASVKLGATIASTKIYCPMCTDQPLSVDGDFPNFLFCPHCELVAEIKVSLSWRHK